MDLITMFQSKRAEQPKNDILSSLSDDERMEYEERGAIMEYDGELSREEAERLALEIIQRRRHYK